MNARIICVLTLSFILTACSLPRVDGTATNTAQSARPTATVTPTIIPTKMKIVPTEVVMPKRTPRPTLTPRPTPEAYEHLLPLKWPIAVIGSEQLVSVRNCDLKKLALQRYPQRIKAEDLFITFEPWSDCDWAVLAAACAVRFERNEPIPEFAKRVLAQVLIHNPGFIFPKDIFYSGYFDAVPIAEAPPIVRQPITTVDIQYDWSGMGEQVAYTIKIREADTTPKVSISAIAGITNTNPSPKIDKELVQALAPALTDLLPIGSQFTLQSCDDSYPDWFVLLGFKDSTTLTLKTNNSNFLYIGGPWQTIIDGQNYIQYSSAFARALSDLVNGLGLSLGEPAAMACFPDDVLDKAFP